MGRLTEILLSSLGADATEVKGQYPSLIATILVPRKRFAEAAKTLKKEYALLAAEWAADETLFGRGFGIYACYRQESEYLIVKTLAPPDDPTFPA